LARIYAQVLGLDRVGVDDSFFELGGDSILSMQVVSRALTAGVMVKPRQVFVEQTVSRLARVVKLAWVVVRDDGNEAVEHVPATPIMRWLQREDGAVDQFNQTVVVEAPVGVTEADVVVVLQALLDRHAMLRARVDDEYGHAAAWSLTVPEAGSVQAGGCLQTVEALSEGAMVEARSRLNPAAGAMLCAVWAASTNQLALVIHHLAVDGVSWRILLEDLNIAWAQHRSGQPIELSAGGTSFARWARLLEEHAHDPAVVAQAEVWRRVAATPAALPAVEPGVDTFANAGQLSTQLDPETTRMLLGEVPAAFHAGVQDILLIAFGLAVSEFLASGAAPVGIDVEGHGRADELADDVDLSRTVGWFTTKYPVSLTVGGLSWARVIAGDPALGSLIKSAKEDLRAMPDGLTYGVLRYLNSDVDLDGPDPRIGFNYLGRLGAAAGELSDEFWRVSPDSGAVARASLDIPLTLPHTIDLNASTADTESGPQLHANWTWAPSAVEEGQVSRLGRLWFEALAGICAHVRRGGAGLTPSDITPVRLSQQQIDELEQRYRIADVLPLTPLQQGLLFHADAAQAAGDDVYAVQLVLTVAGPLDQYRLHEAVRTVVRRHPNLAARFNEQFDQPVQIIPRDAEAGWRYVELATDADEQAQHVHAAEREAVFDLAESPAFRVALIRTAADRHQIVITSNHILMDGWSLSIVLQEMFVSYYGQRLPAAVPYRRFFTWLADRDHDAAQTAWRRVLDGFATPTLVAAPDRLGIGPRDTRTFWIPQDATGAVSELARTHRTTVSTVLQGAWALLLTSLTGQHDVAFGVTVSGRPTEVPGAESMVGLMINTVPMRANTSAETTVADLLEQLQSNYNDTFEHQHMALRDIHRLTGHRQLFDTVFVYENYPSNTAALSSADDLGIVDVSNRDFYHYPLAVQAVPGRELELRVQFRTDVFDAADIESLVERFEWVLSAMITDPTRQLSTMNLVDGQDRARTDSVPLPETHSTGAADRAPATVTERVVAGVFAHVLETDRVGIDESFFDLGGDSLSAMRAIAAINAALDSRLAVTALIDAPSVRTLSQRLTAQ
ncbi:condensation domain-containing protein, partial [Mycobacterium sp. IS-1590]|uniref:condensation domain-containing protein n=1 Tax=Mycobacterium sp. IS-1590 TaxID=1772286 RepID=UPI000AAE67B1